MILTIWNTLLYEPLFNFLIWIYNNWTDQNFGWAIILLTVILRFALLPLTIIAERNKLRNEELWREVQRIDREFKDDSVLKKEEIRRAVKRKKVQPWAKAVTLGIQGLVLLLLYQVFVQGMTGENILKILYSWIDFPGEINTMFHGFDLRARHGILFPAIVAVWLFLEIYIDHRKRPRMLRKADLAYFFLFPASVFFFLWWLPLVKALFILTSMAFSVIVHTFVRMLVTPKAADVDAEEAKK